MRSPLRTLVKDVKKRARRSRRGKRTEQGNVNESPEVPGQMKAGSGVQGQTPEFSDTGIKRPSGRLRSIK